LEKKKRKRRKKDGRGPAQSDSRKQRHSKIVDSEKGRKLQVAQKGRGEFRILQGGERGVTVLVNQGTQDYSISPTT